MIDNQIMTRPKCGTEGCNGIAIGMFNDKFRCSECFIRVVKKVKEANEKLFIKS